MLMYYCSNITFHAALVAILLGNGLAMSLANDENRARTALLVLRSVTLDELKGYVFHPRDDVVNEIEAVRILAALPKPIECSATRSRDALVVYCVEIKEAEFLEMHMETAASQFGFVVESIERARTSIDNAKVLVKTQRDSIVVSSDELRGLIQDYRIKCAVIMEKPSDEVIRDGIVAIYRVDTCTSAELFPN